MFEACTILKKSPLAKYVYEMFEKCREEGGIQNDNSNINYEVKNPDKI